MFDPLLVLVWEKKVSMLNCLAATAAYLPNGKAWLPRPFATSDTWRHHAHLSTRESVHTSNASQKRLLTRHIPHAR